LQMCCLEVLVKMCWCQRYNKREIQQDN